MNRNPNPKLNKKKIKATILHLLNRLGPMSKKKLTHLLYFISMDYYEKYEKHLTGIKFFKTKDGIKF